MTFNTRWIIRVDRNRDAERLAPATAVAYAVIGSLLLGFCLWYGFFHVSVSRVPTHEGGWTLDLWEDFLLPLLFGVALVLSIGCWRVVLRIKTRESVRRRRINDQRSTF